MMVSKKEMLVVFTSIAIAREGRYGVNFVRCVIDEAFAKLRDGRTWYNVFGTSCALNGYRDRSLRFIVSDRWNLERKQVHKNHVPYYQKNIAPTSEYNHIPYVEDLVYTNEEGEWLVCSGFNNKYHDKRIPIIEEVDKIMHKMENVVEDFADFMEEGMSLPACDDFDEFKVFEHRIIAVHLLAVYLADAYGLKSYIFLSENNKHITEISGNDVSRIKKVLKYVNDLVSKYNDDELVSMSIIIDSYSRQYDEGDMDMEFWSFEEIQKRGLYEGSDFE